MKKITLFILTLATAALFAACGAPAGNNAPAANNANANSNANTAKPTAAAPTKDALMALEKSGWEAWKNRDSKWSEENYSAKGIGFGKDGRQDKAAMIKAMADAKCDIKSYSLSDDKMTMLGADVAVLTFKGTQDGTCDGKKVPAAVWASSVYVREGDKWKISDLRRESRRRPQGSAAAKPAGSGSGQKGRGKACRHQARHFDRLADGDREGRLGRLGRTRCQSRRRSRDGQGLSCTCRARRIWIGQPRSSSVGRAKCEASTTRSPTRSSRFSRRMSRSSPTRLTLRALATANRRRSGFWVASFDIKEGDAWKNAFYTDVPR